MTIHRSTILISLVAVLLLTGASCSISFRTAKQLDGGVFRSDDNGITWQQTVFAGKTAKNKPILIDGLDVYAFRFDPTNSLTVYLLTRGAGIYRTDNSGDVWTKTGLSSGTYPAFTIDPQTPAILYAGAGAIIQKSTDSGASWSPIYYESKPDRAITDLAVQPDRPNVVLAGTSTGDILRSLDYGNTWDLSTSIAGTGITRMFFAPSSSSTMYALTTTFGLYRSRDAGTTWEPLATNLAAFTGAEVITSLTTVPSLPDTIYLSTNYGLLVTHDAGTTWKPIQTLVPFASQPIQSVAVNPRDQRVIYAVVGNRLRKSDDGGQSWDAKIVVPTSRILTALSINPVSPSQLFLGTIRPKK